MSNVAFDACSRRVLPPPWRKPKWKNVRMSGGQKIRQKTLHTAHVGTLNPGTYP